MADHINLTGETAKKLENELAETKLELLEVIRNRSGSSWSGAPAAVIAAAYAYNVISGGTTSAPPVVETKQ